MTSYVLDHAKDKELLIIYESEKGISERTVHVVGVSDRFIRTFYSKQWRTFLRSRILSAVPVPSWVGEPLSAQKKQENAGNVSL